MARCAAAAVLRAVRGHRGHCRHRCLVTLLRPQQMRPRHRPATQIDEYREHGKEPL